MTRNLFAFVAVVITALVVMASPTAWAGVAPSTPCIATLLGRSLFETGEIAEVSAIHTGTGNCPEQLAVVGERFYDRLRLDVSKLDTNRNSEFVAVKSIQTRIEILSTNKTTKLAGLALPDGVYRLTTVNVSDFTETVLGAPIEFVVGEVPDTSLGTPVGVSAPLVPAPFIQSARMAEDGTLYFWGSFNSANGFVWQTKSDGSVELIQAEFKQATDRRLASWDGAARTDTSLVATTLPSNGLSARRTVYASVTSNGVTVQGIVLDPLDPAVYIFGSGLSPRQ